MSIINDLRPKPLKAYIPETKESKKYHEVSEALRKVGIHGEENTIETCKMLGWNADCVEIKEQK